MPLTVINQPRTLPRRARVQQRGGSDLSALLFNAVGRGFDTFDRRDMLEQQQQNFLEVLRQQAASSQTAQTRGFEHESALLERRLAADERGRAAQAAGQEAATAAQVTANNLFQEQAKNAQLTRRIDLAGLQADADVRRLAREHQPTLGSAEEVAAIEGGELEDLLARISGFEGDFGVAGFGENKETLTRRLGIENDLARVQRGLVGGLSEGNPQEREARLQLARQFGPRFRAAGKEGGGFFNPGEEALNKALLRFSDELQGGTSRASPRSIRSEALEQRRGFFTQEEAARERAASIQREAIQLGLAPQDVGQSEPRFSPPGALGRLPSVPLAQPSGPLFNMDGVVPPGEGPILGGEDLSIPNETIETRDIFGPLNDPNALGPIGDDIGSELARRALLEAGLIPEFA